MASGCAASECWWWKTGPPSPTEACRLVRDGWPRSGTAPPRSWILGPTRWAPSGRSFRPTRKPPRCYRRWVIARPRLPSWPRPFGGCRRTWWWWLRPSTCGASSPWTSRRCGSPTSCRRPARSSLRMSSPGAVCWAQPLRPPGERSGAAGGPAASVTPYQQGDHDGDADQDDDDPLQGLHPLGRGAIRQLGVDALQRGQLAGDGRVPVPDPEPPRDQAVDPRQILFPDQLQGVGHLLKQDRAVELQLCQLLRPGAIAG